MADNTQQQQGEVRRPPIPAATNPNANLDVETLPNTGAATASDPLTPPAFHRALKAYRARVRLRRWATTQFTGSEW
jgi:hypothetical protein